MKYCYSIFLLLYLETELVALRAKAECHSREIHEMEDKLMALRDELNSSLARISKLTSENAAMKAVKCDLETRVKELIAEKEASETGGNAELMHEKMMSDQKGTRTLNVFRGHICKFMLLCMLTRYTIGHSESKC